MFQDSFSYFKHLTAINIIDIALVLLIIIQMFRALKGSIAFNIF